MENKKKFIVFVQKFYKFAKGLFYFSIMCIVLSQIAVVCYSFGYSLFHEHSVEEAPGTSIEFTVNDNDTVEQIAENLYNVGLIDDKISFRVQAYAFKTNIEPWTYELNTSMTIKEILDVFDDAATSVIAAREGNVNQTTSSALEEEFETIETESANTESTAN